MAEEKKVSKPEVSPKKETKAAKEESSVKEPKAAKAPKEAAEPKAAKAPKEAAEKETKSVKAEKPVKAEAPVKEEKPVKEVQPAKEEKPSAKETKPSKEAKPSKEEAKKSAPAVKIPSRLREKYLKTVVPSLIKKFNYKSAMEVPSLNKIVVNIGVGDATGNPKLLEESVRELGEITGQKPVITKSKLSIANFKLREGQAIGTKVTLRGDRMYQFFDKLITIALPRVRDFRGISKNAFDGRGNYTFGVKEQLIFPEIDFDRVTKIRGMDIVVVTTANTDEESFALLSELGVPFQK